MVSTSPFPDILQPEIQKAGVDARKMNFDFQESKLLDLTRRYLDAPEWRKPELFMEYAPLKEKVDTARVDLAQQQRISSTAEWLAFRDQQIAELEKTNPEFAKDAATVRRLGNEYHDMMTRAKKMTNQHYQILRERDLIENNLADGIVPPGYKTIEEANEASRKMLEKADRLMKDITGEEGLAGKSNKIAGSDEYTQAHVRTQETLRKAGLNRKKIPLAGRLLSAPGIAVDVAQIASIAGVGPLKNYDETGASYTDEEVVDVGGSRRVRSEVEEVAAYHPDNARNNPRISDADRINFFRKRGMDERYLSGLPGYSKWKKEQSEAEAELQARFMKTFSMNR